MSSAGSKSALAPTFATINGVVLKELHIRKSDLCVGNIATGVKSCHLNLTVIPYHMSNNIKDYIHPILNVSYFFSLPA